MGKLRQVTDSSMVLNNDALLDYIRAIYETYDIVDPMIKYGHGGPPQVQSMKLSNTNWKAPPTAQPGGDTLA